MVSHNVRLPDVILDQEYSPYHGNIFSSCQISLLFVSAASRSTIQPLPLTLVPQTHTYISKDDLFQRVEKLNCMKNTQMLFYF